MDEKYVKDAKEIEVNGNPAICIEYNTLKKTNVNRSYALYVFYQEVPYVLEMTVFEGTDIDTAVQIAEGLKLTMTEDAHARHLVDAPEYMPAVTEMIESEEDEMAVLEGSVTATAEQMENTHEIGDSFDYEPADGGMVTARVSSVTVCDDLSMLDLDVMEYHHFAPKQYLDENEKLLLDTLQYIKYGDGMDTIDEIVKTEEENEKLVYVAIDYTNNTETVKKDVLYNLHLTYIQEANNGFSIVNQLKDVDADGVEGTVYGYRHYPDYIYNGKDKEEKNHIIDLKTGETQTVYAAFFVPENMLSCMYLNFNGRSMEEDQQTFEKEALEIGYVDIRQ